ncbi:MAG: hypothetical protein ACXVCH_18550, partial [Bdellovibrionota bacterium]
MKPADQIISSRIEAALSRAPFARVAAWFGPALGKGRAGEKATGEVARKALLERLGGGEGLQTVHSRSHSSGYLLEVAALAAPGVTLGVDFERADRPTQAGLLEKISAPSERALGLSALELWVIKEACFKAHPENQGLVISGIQVV